jgi:hypothetical protein
MSVALVTSTLIGLSPKAFADDNIQISIKADPKIDVALAVGNNSWALSNFNQDLLNRLAQKGINKNQVQIQSVQTSTVSSNDAGASTIFNSWQKYPLNTGDIFKANWQLSGDEIYTTANVHWTGFWDSTKQQTTNQTLQFSTMSTDHDPWGFTFRMKQIGADSYSFYALEWDPNHKILALAKITNWTASASDPMHGGPLYHGVVNASDGYYTGEYYDKGYGGSLSSASGQILSRVPYEVTSGQWDNAKIIANGNNIQIFVNGTKYIDYTDGISPFLQGSYGPYAASNPNSHFKNVRITTETAKKFTEVIRQPIWREGSNRFLVNLENNIISDFDQAQASAEILARLINDEVNYVGLGTTTNQTQVNNFITRNNSNGTFINNSVYSSAMDQLANYIFNKIRSNGNSQYMIMDEDNHLEVNPSSYKTNTQTVVFPNGRWKIEHDSEFYENSMGQAEWSGKWQKDIPTSFDKVGRYEIWFGEDHPTPQYLYVHRRPIADFSLKVTKGTSDYTISVNDKSYDLDMESSPSKGISESEWKWRETTSTTWTDGMIPVSLPVGKDYLVQLRVLDEQGAWSQPLARYVSTGSTALKPIADFQLPTQVTKFKQLNTNDQSYDPAGRVINQKTWTITKNGTQVYTGSNMINDFKSYGAGSYTVTLKVKNDINLWSDVFQRNIIVTEDLANPAISFSPNEATWISENIPVTISFNDDSGISNSLYKVTQSTEVPTSWDTANTDSQKITLANEGQWYIHAKAQDLAGKVTTAVAGPYQIQSKPVAPELKVNQVTQTKADIGWTLPTTAITDGIKYELVNQTTKQVWTVNYPTDHVTNEDLKAGTVYEYVLKVKNNVGEVVSDPFKVLTLPANVEGFKIDFKDYHSNQATISFDAVPSATGYKFNLYKTSKDGQEQVNQEDWNDAGKHEIGNLEEGTQYFASVTAKNASGEGESASIGFISLPAAPGEFKTIQITDRSIELGWVPSDTADQYELFRDDDSLYRGAELSFLDEGVHAATIYKYQLSAKNESGFGDITELDVLTLPGTTELNIETITDTTIDLSWKKVAGADQYVIYVNGTPAQRVKGDLNQVQLDELDSGTKYELSIRTENESGQGLPTLIQAKTLSAAPQNITFDEIGENSVIVKWDSVQGADKYKVVLQNLEYEVSVSEMKLTDLQGDHTYTVQVLAGNESGYGEASEASMATIPNAPMFGVDKVTANAITVSWNKQNTANSYRVYDKDSELLVETKELTYTLSKLTAGETYDLFISAVNQSGEGGKAKLTQQTLPGGWGSTEGELRQVVQVSGITLDSVTVSWKVALGADQYKVVNAQGNILGQVTAPTRTVEIANLNYDTAYTGWNLIPLNAAGEGEAAPVPAFKTLVPYYGGNEVPKKEEEKQVPVIEPEKPIEKKPYFEDITSSFARSEILELAKRGIVKGISDSQFAPDQKVTRVEFASMLVRALKLQEASDVPLTFEDIQKSAWYVPELSAAILSGVAHGFSDKEFKPQDPITREQASKMIANAVYDGLMPSGEINFKDGNSIAVWAKPEVTALSAEKVVTGYPDGSFKPKRDLTRAECAVLIYRSLILIK